MNDTGKLKELKKSSLKDNLFLGNKNEKRIRRAIIATILRISKLRKIQLCRIFIKEKLLLADLIG